MIYTFATKDNEAEIRRLLAENDLHHEDITLPMLTHFLLGSDGPRLVGVVGLEIKSHSALLRSLAVDSKFRNRGIATNLIRRIEDHAKSLKIETLYLLTMTAEQFFNKHGFQSAHRESAPADIQETAEFQSLCPASAVCMIKHIGNCLKKGRYSYDVKISLR